jgi:hypothetical protein
MGWDYQEFELTINIQITITIFNTFIGELKLLTISHFCLPFRLRSSSYASTRRLDTAGKPRAPLPFFCVALPAADSRQSAGGELLPPLLVFQALRL